MVCSKTRTSATNYGHSNFEKLTEPLRLVVTEITMRNFGRTLAPVLAAGLLVTALGCREDTTSPTEPEATPALATASTPLSFLSVSAGGFHTCGIAVDNRAYCWGNNDDGQLGDGTTTDRSRPVAVARGLQFVQVSASESHTCGVTTGSLVYCWGKGADGRLGTGFIGNRLKPAPVSGARHFRQVNAGGAYSCAVTPENRAYCWGDNTWGQLGDGTTTDRLTPVPVAGGLSFRRVIAGSAHTCGVTTGNKGFCWGNNYPGGQLGDGTTTQRLKPVAVAGGLSFRYVLAGGVHSCGLTTADQAYCWGFNEVGQLGDGTTTRRLTPVAVSGGRSFDQVVPGSVSHTCAVTTGHRAFCWGDNFAGALGDGTTTDRHVPVVVSGGLLFSGVSPGDYHTCGVTTGGRAYCWGHDGQGQLGDGAGAAESCYSAIPCSTKPRAVVGPV